MLSNAGSPAECSTLRSNTRCVRLSTSVLVAATLAASVMFVSGPRLAWACSCIFLGDQSSFNNADVVFRGELVGYEPPPTSVAMSSDDLATWTFAVQEVYKGKAAEMQDVVSAWMGMSCGLELPHEGEFYVFAHHHHVDPAQLGASLCGGTRSVADGPLAVADITPGRAAPVAAGTSGITRATSLQNAASPGSPATGGGAAITSPTRDWPFPQTTPSPAPEPGPDGDANEPVVGGTDRVLLASLGLAVIAALLGARAAGMRRRA